MSDQQRDSAEFFTARGFGRRIGFGARPALLTIDFQNGFCDPQLPLGAALDHEVEQTCVLLEAARRARIPIVFTVASFDQADLSDAGVWALKQAGIASLMASTSAVELDARLARRPNEHLITKKYASSFFGTDLSSRLTSAGVDTVLITGCTTSGCVRATAVDAVQLGFRPIVVREAVGDRSPAAHEQSLLDLDFKYADVVGAAQTLDYIRALKPSV